MSQFVDTIKTFSKEYELRSSHRAKLLLHYPLFKLNWYSNYGNGFLKTISKFIYPFFKYYSIEIQLLSKNKKLIKIPISFNECDLASFKEVFWGLEYGEVTNNNKIKTVVDVGANTGMASLFFWANTALEKIIIVEANPMLAQKISNIFTDERTIVENVAVYGERGNLRFVISDNHRESSLSNDQKAEGEDIIRVNTVLIGDLLKKHSLENVDLLKMDIEGAEYSILEKDPESFLNFKRIYIEIHGEKKTRGRFRAELIGLGFNLINTSGEEHSNCETCYFVRSE